MKTEDKSTEVTLRDYLAIHATDDDVFAMLGRVQLVDLVADDGPGRKKMVRGLPDNARQIARYMHADAMLRARGTA